MPTPSKPAFAETHKQLRKILTKHAKGPLKATRDAQGADVLMGPPSERTRGKELWFGAVRTGKAYVSYHLIGVYAFPDLLKDASPELKKRMQGKACFNFRAPHPKLFKELDRLTADSYRRLKQEGYIP
jgi:hypothetical protein